MDPEERRTYYEEHIYLKASSSWQFLRDATESCVEASVLALRKLHAGWQALLDTGRPPMETAVFVAGMYSVTASGPLLSSVLFPAFAIEALLRLTSELRLREQVTVVNALKFAVNGFDVLPFSERLGVTLELLEAGSPPAELRKQLQDVVDYRNGVVHPAPTWAGPDGWPFQLKRAKLKIGMFSESEVFPDLVATILPLNLQHTLRAVRAHDDLVRFLRQAVSEDIQRQLESGFLGRFSTIEDTRNEPWTQIDSASIQWSAVERWVESISYEDQVDFFADYKRRQTIKPVPDT